jgi:hypothetical protein
MSLGTILLIVLIIALLGGFGGIGGPLLRYGLLRRRRARPVIQGVSNQRPSRYLSGRGHRRSFDTGPKIGDLGAFSFHDAAEAIARAGQPRHDGALRNAQLR